MCLQGQFRRYALGIACFVREGGIRCEDELITDREFVIGDDVGSPDRVAGRIPIPPGVLFGWITNVVDLVGWVISMDVNTYTTNRSFKLIG